LKVPSREHWRQAASGTRRAITLHWILRAKTSPLLPLIFRSISFSLARSKAMTSAFRILGVCFALLIFTGAGRAADDDQGYLGVQFKLNPNGEGMLIIGLEGEAAGEKGGLKMNDIILKANGNKLAMIMDLVDAVKDTKPGETIVLTILRDNEEKEFKIKVGKRPAQAP
jgi:predicted metalloprotease with PDZ domain